MRIPLRFRLQDIGSTLVPTALSSHEAFRGLRGAVHWGMRFEKQSVLHEKEYANSVFSTRAVSTPIFLRPLHQKIVN